MENFFGKLKKTRHTMQWQIIATITIAAVLVCFLILVYRAIKLIDVLKNSSSSTVLANSVSQLLSDTSFMDNFDPEKLIGVNEDGKNYINMQKTQEPEQHPDVQLGFLFDSMRIDFGFIERNNIKLIFVDKNMNVYPLVFDRKGSKNAEEKAQKEIDALENRAVEMVRQNQNNTNYGHLIVSETDYSEGLVQCMDKDKNVKGTFFLYVHEPDPAMLIRGMLRSSMRSIIGMILFSAAMGLLIGLILSRKWSLWFNNTIHVINQWSEGSFEQKIPISSNDYTEWQQLSVSLNDMSDQLAQVFQTRQELAASEERNRLSRELHDNIKQQLFSVNMNLATASALFTKKPDQSEEKLDLARNLTQNTLEELDVLIGGLRLPVSSNEHFVEKLSAFIETWKKSSEIDLKVDEDQIQNLDTGTSQEIFRIIQEGLSNVMRHSNAKKAALTLKSDGIGTTLIIADDGHGFDPVKVESGMGLNSMKERVEKLNGTFRIDSSDKGTGIFIYIPRNMEI